MRGDPVIPTDGYAPGGTQYRIRLLDALELDVVTLDITYGDPQVMSADQIDALLRPLMETLRDQVEVEALVPGQIQLLVGHHGTRIDDITPPPPGGEG
jgi:hypothetical protein